MVARPGRWLSSNILGLVAKIEVHRPERCVTEISKLSCIRPDHERDDHTLIVIICSSWQAIHFLVSRHHLWRCIRLGVDANLTSIGSGPILIERREVERGKDIVSEDRFYNVNEWAMKNVVDCDRRESRIIFGEIPGAFFDERNCNGATSPTVLCSKGVRLVLKILADEPILAIMRKVGFLG